MAHGLLILTGMSELFSNISPLQRALDYHSERHNVVASNVANANTPGFRPMELLRVEDQQPLGGSLPLKVTQEAHLDSASTDPHHGATLVEDESALGGLDGNSVSLEREMSKLAANDLRYESAAKMLSHKLGMLRYAANDGNG